MNGYPEQNRLVIAVQGYCKFKRQYRAINAGLKRFLVKNFH